MNNYGFTNGAGAVPSLAGYNSAVSGAVLPNVPVPQADVPNAGGLGMLGKVSLGMQGVTGLLGAYNAIQQNELLRKQFRASLADRNQNIANQAKTTNLSLANQSDMAAQMYGYQPGSDQHKAYVKDNLVQVDGSPIRV